MTKATLLPAEILVSIFNYLDEIRDATEECRLVCSAWNNPAERAMFEHEVTISSDEAKIQTLHAVLIKNP
ncbi:hypothetical protein MBANPS3_006378, partial [Mucor bainieri]